MLPMSNFSDKDIKDILGKAAVVDALAKANADTSAMLECLGKDQENISEQDLMEVADAVGITREAVTKVLQTMQVSQSSEELFDGETEEVFDKELIHIMKREFETRCPWLKIKFQREYDPDEITIFAVTKEEIPLQWWEKLLGKGKKKIKRKDSMADISLTDMDCTIYNPVILTVLGELLKKNGFELVRGYTKKDKK